MSRPRSEPRAALRHGRWELGALLVFSAVFNVLMLTPSLYMLQVFDRVMLSRSELSLLAISLLALALLLLLALADVSRARLLGRWVAGLDQALAPRVLAASFAQALGAEQGLRQAGAADEPLRDWNSLKRFLNGPGVTAFLDAPWTPIYAAVLFLLHPLLGALALAFVLVQAGLAWHGHHRLLAPRQQAEQAQAEAAAFVNAKLRNAEVITALGMTHSLLARWQAKQERALQAQGRADALGHRVSGVSKWVRYSQQSLGLGAGALLVIQGELSAGAMIAATFLLMRALAPIEQLAGSWPAFIQAVGAFKRLDAQLLQVDALPVEEMPDLAGDCVLQGVSLQLPGRDEPLLAGVNLHARPGTVTLIAGASGSGKSTLAKALVGLWPHTQGDIRVDGRTATDWAEHGWNGQLGYLPQDVLLGEGSVAENIARGAEPESAEVIAAARAVGLHHAILSLPQGYDTPVGERGSHLSGGLRQRIALARAVYGQPRLLVLDEPNAQLDEAGESALLACLQQLKSSGSTVIVISHRPLLRGLADQVVSLQAGAAAVMPVAAVAARPVVVAPA